MVIKIIALPYSEITGDLGTFYIVTEHKGFIQALKSISDYKVMMRFLSENARFFIELQNAVEEYDEEINVCPFEEWKSDLNLCELMVYGEENINTPNIRELDVR